MWGHNLEIEENDKEKKDTKCEDLIDALLEKHGISPEAVLGENGLIAQLKKRVVERALAGELTHHLGYAKGERPKRSTTSQWVEQEDGGRGKRRDGDRGSPGSQGSFEPLLIAKGQKRLKASMRRSSRCMRGA